MDTSIHAHFSILVDPRQPDAARAWAEAQLDTLWAGETQAVAEAIGGLPHAEAAEPVGYFSNNAERVHYAEFRAQELPIGSGVMTFTNLRYTRVPSSRRAL